MAIGPGAVVGLHAQMDARAMSGIPRPVDDVPDGTVVVRLVRQELGSYVTNHPVDLDVGGRIQTARTDQEGRVLVRREDRRPPKHGMLNVEPPRQDVGRPLTAWQQEKKIVRFGTCRQVI